MLNFWKRCPSLWNLNSPHYPRQILSSYRGSLISLFMVGQRTNIASKLRGFCIYCFYHRPYHAYCLYVGANSDPRYTEVFQQVISCYQKLYPHTTIFMATNTTEVKWGKYSLIEADFHCMRDLLSRKNQ